MNKELLKHLHELPEFRILLDELKKSRPIIPKYDPVADNHKEVCGNIMKQQGYDMALFIINPFERINNG